MNTKVKNGLIITCMIVGVILVLSFAAGILYNWLVLKNISSIDTATIVSIILAFFSIILSMMFYFKATETSNKFYDTSFTFMSKQSEIIGRFEAKFGEKLNNMEKVLSQTRGIGNQIELNNVELQKALKEKDNLEKRLIEKDGNIGELQTQLNESRNRIEELLENNVFESNKLKSIMNSNKNINNFIRSEYTRLNKKSIIEFDEYPNLVRLINILNEKRISIDEKLIDIFTKYSTMDYEYARSYIRENQLDEIRNWLKSRSQIPKKKTISSIINELSRDWEYA